MTKNTSYHYSIIIPHKNTPRLLERCLCSIPTWDEIQIIIIDDNSNSESVDFSHFPGNGRKNTEVLFTKEGKGAGYARNIGLSHARGKWIIFADADDFFTADCFTILNEYMDSPHKVIYFNVRFVMSDDPSQESRRGTYYTNFFNDVNPENKLRYQSQVPWGKMIRRSFLSTFHIQFDETRIANDVYFSCLVGIYAPKVTTDRRIIYYCTESDQSLAMSKQDRESLIIRFNASMKCNRLLRQEKIHYYLSTFHIQFDETRIANDVYFSCLVGIYAPKVTTDRRIIYYCTESDQSLAMSKQDRESLIIRFNASMKCNRLLRQEKIHYYLSPLPWCIPSAKTKEWLPAKYFFEYLFFFRLQAFKELYYAFSAILSHMNEPATKETDNQCNKKTTNLKE